MSLTKAISLIQSQNGETATDSGIGFVTNFGIKSKFKVDLTSFGSFYLDILGLSDREQKIIHNNIHNDNFDSSQYGLPFCEEITDMLPIIIDINLEFVDNDCVTFYGSDFIIGIVNELQEIICSFIEYPQNDHNSDDPEQLRCFVLETPIWRDSDKQYQNIRFQFPYTKISKNILNGFVIKELIIGLTNKELIRKLTKMPIVTDWGQIIQKVDNSISMYGSKKTINSAPLMLRSVFTMISDYNIHDNIEDETSESYCVQYETYELINPLDCSLVNQCLINKTDLEFNDKLFSLPLMLSIYFCDKFSQIIPDSIQMGDEPVQKKFIASTSGCVQDEDQISMFNALLPLISRNRFTLECKYYWYTFGKAIFNIFNGSRIGFNIYMDVSSPDLQLLCEKTWTSFNNEYYDIRVIMEYAKNDNPDKYKEWHDTYCRPIVALAKGGKDMIVAELVKHMLRLECIFCRDSGIWYYKKNSCLKKDIGALELKNVISKRLRVPYYEMREEYEKARDEAPTPDQKKIYKGLIAEVDKFIGMLDDGNYLDRVIKAARGKMYDDNFTELKDENLNIMACTNCTLEVYDKAIINRPFMIQDYITKNTNIGFPVSYDDETAQVKALVQYYSQVFAEKDVYRHDGTHSHLCKSIFCNGNPALRLCYGELCHHVLKVNSSILIGGNDEKLFTNLIGLPNRSKSKIVEVKEKSLGGYCVDLPAECITIVKGKQSGGADPAIEQAKGARLFNVKETSKHEPIDISKVKKWTGNDRYYNRTLHREGGSRCISGKLWHMSNVIGDEPNADEGYNVRKVIIPFLVEFMEKPPCVGIEQYNQKKFKMDESFSKTIPSLAQADLYLMFRFFNIYCKEGIKNQPKLVKDTTEHQKQDSDAYYNFIKEKLVVFYVNENTKEIDRSKSMGVFDLFIQYSRWYKTFSPASFISINQNDFKNELIKEARLGPLNEINQWEGIGLRTVAAKN